MRRVRSLIAVLAGLLALGLLAVAPVGAQDSIEIDLVEIDGSGVNGTAILTDEGDAVTVEIEVSGDSVVGGHPVHIHEGTCDNLDPAPAYPLADIDEDGLSETTVEGITLADLQASDFAINAHLSAEEIGVYVTCGNISSAEGDTGVGAGDTETETTTTTAPSTGVGSGLVGSSSDNLLLSLVVLAGALGAAGVALRVRETRA
jgi:hypothetical protein